MHLFKYSFGWEKRSAIESNPLVDFIILSRVRSGSFQLIFKCEHALEDVEFFIGPIKGC